MTQIPASILDRRDRIQIAHNPEMRAFVTGKITNLPHSPAYEPTLTRCVPYSVTACKATPLHAAQFSLLQPLCTGTRSTRWCTTMSIASSSIYKQHQRKSYRGSFLHSLRHRALACRYRVQWDPCNPATCIQADIATLLEMCGLRFCSERRTAASPASTESSLMELICSRAAFAMTEKSAPLAPLLSSPLPAHPTHPAHSAPLPQNSAADKRRGRPLLHAHTLCDMGTYCTGYPHALTFLCVQRSVVVLSTR